MYYHIIYIYIYIYLERERGRQMFLFALRPTLGKSADDPGWTQHLENRAAEGSS